MSNEIDIDETEMDDDDELPSIGELREFLEAIEDESAAVEEAYQQATRELTGTAQERNGILKLYEILKDTVMPAITGLGTRMIAVAEDVLENAEPDGSLLLPEDAQTILTALTSAAQLVAKIEAESAGVDDTRYRECEAVGNHLAAALKLVKDLMVEDDDAPEKKPN
jgi:hypothetical protein